MTTVNIEMQGLNTLVKELQAISGGAEGVVEDVISDLATDTKVEAVFAIQDPSKTGRIYTRGNVRHQASAPYEAPASDTGNLMGSIDVDFEGPLTAYVGTHVMYGMYLEFGTRGSDDSPKILPRPWLLPSFEKAKIGVSAKLKEDIERLINRV